MKFPFPMPRGIKMKRAQCAICGRRKKDVYVVIRKNEMERRFICCK